MTTEKQPTTNPLTSSLSVTPRAAGRLAAVNENSSVPPPYQLLSPPLQRVTLFLPLGGGGRELLGGALAIQAPLSLSLLSGQVALLIAGSERTQKAQSCERAFGKARSESPRKGNRQKPIVKNQ